MEVKKNTTREYKHFLYLLIFLPLLLWFYICQKHVHPKYIIHSRIDDYIPFLKIFIIPYLFWFFYIGMGLLYFGLKSKKDYFYLLKLIYISMTVCYIIYCILPSGQELRPIIKDTDILSKLINLIYSIDPPTNVCPSLHVIDAISVNIVVWNSELFTDNKKIKILSLICMILICLSTMFIKQHSVIDVFTGIAFSIVLYLSVYILPELFQNKEVKANTK